MITAESLNKEHLWIELSEVSFTCLKVQEIRNITFDIDVILS